MLIALMSVLGRTPIRLNPIMHGQLTAEGRQRLGLIITMPSPKPPDEINVLTESA
jgi:hypothetical protein